MARIRTIKPGFFRHAELYDAEKASGLPLRIAFAGLWTCADREGRFKWVPRSLKLDCLPYDEVDFADVMEALAHHGFIVKYIVDGVQYAHIPSFLDHQVINQREAQSVIPAPPDPCTAHARTETHVHAHGEQEGKGTGREEEGDTASLRSAAAAPPAKDEFWREGVELVGPSQRSALGRILKLVGEDYEAGLDLVRRCGANVAAGRAKDDPVAWMMAECVPRAPPPEPKVSRVIEEMRKLGVVG